MKIFFIFFIFLLSSPFVAADAATDAQALSAFNNVKSSFSSADAVATKLQKPLTSGTTMTTLDGSNSFTAQLSCQAEAEFLNVTVNPLPSNDAYAFIQMDQDLDGSYEYSHSINNISGVCRNGFVSCDAGTWDNCNHFLLEATPTISITPLTTKIDKMGLFGCYCFNDSCGSNLATTNAGQISETLSTTIAMSLANYDAKYIASRIETNSNNTSYFGQDIASCANDPTGAGRASDMAQAKRTDNDTFITTEGISVAASQPADSPYDLAMTQQGHGFLDSNSEVSCNVSRTLSYSTQTGLNDEEFATLSMFAQGRDYISCDFSLKTGVVSCLTDGTAHIGTLSNTIDPDEMCNAQTTVSISNIEWFNPPIAWGTLDTTGYIDYEISPSCANDFQGRIRLRDEISSSETRWFLNRAFTFRVSKPSCFLNESIHDGCTTIDQNTCTLYEEKVDAVTTIQGTFDTGLAVSPSVLHVSSALCSSFETRPWFIKERKYNCIIPGTGITTDLSHLEDPTIVGNQGTIDINGNDITFEVPSITLPSCQETCEVQSIELDTQTNLDGQSSDSRTDNSRIKKTIKTCINNSCPLEAGETISTACGCTNNFGKAATAMQMLRLAGQDIICTTGTLTEY
jgi:hypothetical protein